MEKEYNDIYASQIDSFVGRQPHSVKTEDIVKYLACLAIKGETSEWIVPKNSQTSKFNADMIELGLSAKEGRVSHDTKGLLQHIFISEHGNHSFREMDFNKINAIYRDVLLETRVIQSAAGIIESFNAENNMGVDRTVDAAKYIAALAVKAKVPDGIIDSELRTALNKKAYNAGIINQEGVLSQDMQKILQRFFENAPGYIMNEGLKAVYSDTKKIFAENDKKEVAETIAVDKKPNTMSRSERRKKNFKDWNGQSRQFP